MSNDSKSAAKSATESTPMTARELITAQAPVMVEINPIVAHGPDGAPSFVIQSLQGRESGARKLTQAASVAHAAGMTPRMAAREAARLYRAMLADALVECGIDSPVLRRVAGRSDSDK